MSVHNIIKSKRGLILIYVVIGLLVVFGIWAMKSDKKFKAGPVELGPKETTLPTNQTINGDQFGLIQGDVLKDSAVKNVYVNQDSVRK